MSTPLKSWNLGKGLRDKERRVNCVKSGSTINGNVPFGVVNFLARKQYSVWDRSQQTELIYANIAEAITRIHFSPLTLLAPRGKEKERVAVLGTREDFYNGKHNSILDMSFKLKT